jgi:hypothetical protein
LRDIFDQCSGAVIRRLDWAGQALVAGVIGLGVLSWQVTRDPDGTARIIVQAVVTVLEAVGKKLKKESYARVLGKWLERWLERKIVPAMRESARWLHQQIDAGNYRVALIQIAIVVLPYLGAIAVGCVGFSLIRTITHGAEDYYAQKVGVARETA